MYKIKIILTYILTSVVALLALVGAISLIGTYDTGKNSLSQAREMIYTAEINVKIQRAMKDPFAIEIANNCSKNPSIKQPNCVIEKIEPYFNYTIKKPMMIMPSEYKEKGGSCSDTTILHSAIFKLLGWDVQYIFPNSQHIYLLINKKIPCIDNETEYCDLFCDIDGNQHVCKLLI